MRRGDVAGDVAGSAHDTLNVASGGGSGKSQTEVFTPSERKPLKICQRGVVAGTHGLEKKTNGAHVRPLIQVVNQEIQWSSSF